MHGFKRPSRRSLFLKSILNKYIPVRRPLFDANFARSDGPRLAKAAFVGANTVSASPGN